MTWHTLRPLVILPLAFASIPLWSQDPPPPGQQPPGLRAEANYVRVDAFVTRDGSPASDLTIADFDVFEDGVRQTVTDFEYVNARVPGQSPAVAEPRTLTEARALLESSRQRAVVLFLDTYHVGAGYSRTMDRPLARLLDRVVTPGDLIAVMMPEMTAAELTFTTSTRTVEDVLSTWWGQRDRINTDHYSQDELFQKCFPGPHPLADGSCRGGDQEGLASQMIARRREKATLDSLQSLVDYLSRARRGRTAVIVVSDGWTLFQPNQRMTEPGACGANAGQPQMNLQGGRIGAPQGPVPRAPADPADSCSTAQGARTALALVNHQDAFRELAATANRANVTFYTVDPRGLPATDTGIVMPGPYVGALPQGLSLMADAQSLRARLDSLRGLALDTDGLSVTGSNDIDRGLQRISDDLTSYYLLGYYSTGRLDGRFHSISVRMTRPGLQVRARRGYRALSAAEVNAAQTASASRAAIRPEIAAAIGSLGAAARVAPMRLSGVTGWNLQGRPAAWITIEVAADRQWASGGQVDVLLANRAGENMGSARGTIEAGARGTVVTVLPSGSVAPGEYVAQVRARPTGGTPIGEETPITFRSSPAVSGALLFRSGQTRASVVMPTADARFRRIERLILEIPANDKTPGTARLLDRVGNPLAVPATVTIREDAAGMTWQRVEIVLSPLAQGDYVVEYTGPAERPSEPLFTGFRIIP